MARRTVNTLPSIDSRALARSVDFTAGIGAITMTTPRERRSVPFDATETHLTIWYASPEVTKMQVRLDRTSCHFGGYRLWFLCPRCDARAAILYLGTDQFECRLCLRLTYQSQNESRVDRAYGEHVTPDSGSAAAEIS